MRKTKRTIRRLPGKLAKELAAVQNDLDRLNRRIAALVGAVAEVEVKAGIAEKAAVEVERLRVERS